MRSPVRIGFIAPSGQILDEAPLERAIAYFENLGCKVVVPGAIRLKHQRFAGTDAQRVNALHAMVKRRDVDIVMAVRGGYGLTRLLQQIDYQLLAQSGKIFCGHSDFTALSLALYAQTKTVSLAGPTALFDFGAEPDNEHGLAAHGVSAFTEAHFWGLLHARSDTVAFESDAAATLDVPGRLWGSNLAMLVNVLGTPYVPKIRNGILFVEDVNEHPFRVERMLYQLLHSGVLAQQRALVLGDFNGYKLWPNDNGYDFAQMVKHFRTVCPIPIVTGLPFGHVRDKVTLPIGGKARVSQSGRKVTLSFSL